MADTYATTEARADFGSLVRRTALARERITITDRGQPAAVLMNPQEPADLEDALALSEYLAREATGTARTVPHHQARPPRPGARVSYEIN
ncbi:type II toxin-antitoxin system Phd/YefM family antitoxin [Streptomyces sp. NPDC020883]|uniref:type II toxin-antitoxin system Phd/YefM family antitoxin n=1 Tax=Streptomyces sp. NPDC020883 TaxID=3365099 RepID=UPI0037A140B3